MEQKVAIIIYSKCVTINSKLKVVKYMCIKENILAWRGYYSGANWKVYEYCFMKQKCQLQMGIAQYQNLDTPLSTKGINTTPHISTYKTGAYVNFF